MDAIRDAIFNLVELEHPMTVRQVFYRLVSMGLIEKTQSEYSGTVCRLLVEMRLSGVLPFHWIVDNTRWMRKPSTYSGLGEMVELAQRTYRRALWDNQPAYVEVWCEKDALAGVIYEVTSEWDVPLMVTRGQASLSFLHSASEAIEQAGKPAYIYYFGDHDHDGLLIAQNVEQRLNEFADAEIVFERSAVTIGQIEKWNLPTRPPKSRRGSGKMSEGPTVDLDAIPPDRLRALVRERIERHVDPVALGKLKAVEDNERELLGRILHGAASELNRADSDAADELSSS